MKPRIGRLIHWAGVSFLVLFVIGQAAPSGAQARTGAIAGTVTDPTGAVLIGAQVSLDPPPMHVVTNQQGRFLFSGLSEGRYALTITYVGFSNFTQVVEIEAREAAGTTIRIDATLQIASEDQTVLVSAPRATGEAEALNIERSSDNVVQVLPSEVIRSLPNANMADALGRLPSVTLERDEGEGKYVQVRGTEPRLTNTTVDGVYLPPPEPGVRQVKFDAIPADLVERVDVNKTLLASMDGDGIGASVNLITKTATDHPTMSFGTIGGYTPIIHGRGETENTATIGSRFGANKQFGIMINGSYDWNGRGIDDIEPVPDVATLPNGSNVSWKDGTDIREYQYFRSRVGVAGSADDRIGPASDIAVRWLYADFKNYGDRWDYSLVDNTPGVQLLNPGNAGCSTDDSGVTVAPCSGTASYNAQLRNPDIGVGNVKVGGKHVLSTTMFSWDVAAGRSSYGNAPYSTAGFSSTLDTSNCQFNPTATVNPYLPQWTAPCYAEAYSPSNFTLGNINRSLGPSAQTNLQAGGTATKVYQVGSRSAALEFGGKYRHDRKYNNAYRQNYFPTGTIFLSAFPNRLVNSNYYNGGQYPLGYNASYEDVMAYATANPGAFTSNSTAGHDPSDFTIVEQVGAGYVMNTIDLSNRAKFIAGVRVEGTSANVNNFSIGRFSCAPPQTGTCTSTNPNTFSGSYVTVLPSASLSYGLTSNDTLRLVYARGLARPDFVDLAQALNWSVAGNGANRYSVSLGNAALKAETGDDVDVLLDHYFQAFGDLSVGYFYKALRNPIVTQTFVLRDFQPVGGPLANYLGTQPVNAGSAWINGFEASYLQHFSSLRGFLGGLGLSANYGYTASGTNGIPGRSDQPRLLRTSPSAFNISPTYDRGPISLRLGLSYNQASIYSYQYTDGTPGGVNGPLSDLYFYSHIQVDAQASVRVAQGLNVVIAGLNLNNGVFGFYQGDPQYMIQREYYQPTYEFGIRWVPGR